LITVAIDAEHTRQTSAGTARYSRSLVKALSERDDIRPVEVGGGPLESRGTLRKRLVTARQDFAWYPWLGRRRAAGVGAHIYHCPTPRAPTTKGKPPLIVTVHDLVSVLFPETMTLWSRIYARATLTAVLRAADLIVTPSQDTANDLNVLMRVSPDRIRVAWNGVDEIFFTSPLSAPEVQQPYVLFVGTPEPRKNLARLVEAMRSLRSRGHPHRLIIAGGGGWGNVGVDTGQADFLGRVSDERLHALYAHATCLALPSLHEGFGLPAVEAMAAGTPVVAGSRGALPEVTGGAAVLVDPYDSGAIALGIERAIGERASLVAAGRARARQFTWSATARTMAGIYRELA
jgi:glycosyltransferase involved in cell wall biosynthesis